jgi:hypothetical protein
MRRIADDDLPPAVKHLARGNIYRTRSTTSGWCSTR